MDRDELLKEKLMSKKESIKSAFLNRLTYDKWDKKSPVYAYSILTSEFEKRNPTNIEKLGNQVTKSYPYSVKPEEYWADKTENSNYSTEDDNNGKGNEVYSITNADVNDNNWNEIAKSFDDEDSFMYNQTLNNLLRIR